MTDVVTTISLITSSAVAITSTVIAYKTLRHTVWKDSTEIKVEINKINLGFPKPQGDMEWSEDMVGIKVANTGNKPYTVTMLGFNIGRRSGHYKMPLPVGTHPVPHELKPGKTCDFWIEYKKVKKEAKKIKRNKTFATFYTQDYMGQYFSSNKLTFRFKESWLFKRKKLIKNNIENLLIKILP